MSDKNLPQNVPETEYTYVSRNIINKKRLNLEFAIHSLGTDDRIEPEQKLQELQDLKQCCRDTFRHEIEAMMLDEIQNQRLSYFEVSKEASRKKKPVKTMSQLRKSIKQHHSVKYFERLFKVLFGIFDDSPGWAKTLETKYMETKKLKYRKESSSTHSERDKGCFEIMATDVKSEIIHQLQKIGKQSTHGAYLTLQLPKKDNKRVQRKKGLFYVGMIKRSKIAEDALDEMEVLSSDDDSSLVEDIQERGNVRIHFFFKLRHALTKTLLLSSNFITKVNGRKKTYDSQDDDSQDDDSSAEDTRRKRCTVRIT